MFSGGLKYLKATLSKVLMTVNREDERGTAEGGDGGRAAGAESADGGVGFRWKAGRPARLNGTQITQDGRDAVAPLKDECWLLPLLPPAAYPRPLPQKFGKLVSWRYSYIVSLVPRWDLLRSNPTHRGA